MTSSNIPSFIIAGTHSGVGKTTASFALMSSLAKRGLEIQPFKIGPDFIDPGYHKLATGRLSINLDRYLMGWEDIQNTYNSYSQTAHISVIEAMGALHDGENGTDIGSAADFSNTLNIPILLVVDIGGMTRSTEAVILGFENFNPKIKISAILLNRAGSEKHYQMVLQSLSEQFRKKVIGYLPAHKDICVEERHLGLKTVEENPKKNNLKENVLKHVENTLNIEYLLSLLNFNIIQPVHFVKTPSSFNKVRIGIAKDQAFCFYYQYNLKALEDAGAELVFFSPVYDSSLPSNLAGIYLGGGYPESFAREIEENTRMKLDIKHFAEKGFPIYAECGGLMYLAETLTGFNSKKYAMTGVLPLSVKMDSSYLAIRYVEIKTTETSLLGPAETQVRGQEFHQSRILHSNAAECYNLIHSTDGKFSGGFKFKNVVCSYVHLHFASNKSIAPHFVRFCKTTEVC